MPIVRGENRKGADVAGRRASGHGALQHRPNRGSARSEAGTRGQPGQGDPAGRLRGEGVGVLGRSGEVTVERIKNWMNHPANRRQFLTLGSGLLIAVGLITGGLLHLNRVQAILFLLACAAGGIGYRAPALHSLRNRHVSIELLVTIATAGALIIGENWKPRRSPSCSCSARTWSVHA